MAHQRCIHTCCGLLKKVTTNQLKSKAKGLSSQLWLSRQLSDPYVEKAKVMNLRCRSAFKLMEIDDRFNILKPGYVVIDCGAAPGSWTQVAVHRVNANRLDEDKPIGTAIAVDKQHVHPIEGATILGSMDFTIEKSQEALRVALNGQKADVVLSDMAPTATGVRDLDNENMLKLCYTALRFAVQNSKEGASVLLKMWQCGDTKKLVDSINRFYSNVKIVKPQASRSDSTEIFLLGREFKGVKS